ncbi:MAG: hypothetical protein SH848_10995 [Saprospiraceae bacterium]|nr:hypothetical protein [Saprospiraceae bacterium]MDZ4704447.1 hypothetical protein [Saprospiraceae bacterium]
MNKNAKEFDAVEMMRLIRTNLHQKFLENLEIREQLLEEIRKKFGIKSPVADLVQDMHK